jgi:putative protease
MDELEGMANRGFTEGFYRRHVPGEYQNYENGNSVASKQLFVADVCEVDLQNQRLSLTVKNKITLDDDLVLLTPAGNIPFQLHDMFQHNSTEVLEIAPGSGYQADIVIPELAQHQITAEALDKGLLVRSLAAKGQ